MATSPMSAHEIPDDFVPASNDDLLKTFRGFVSFLVRKYNRVDTNFDDLVQHTWMKLIEVDVLSKYHQSGNFPRTLTGEQAAAFCSVTFRQWKVAIWRGLKNNEGRERHSWIPQPVEGGWASKKAVYLTEHVEQLLSSGYFRKKHETTEVCPRTRSKFKPYLARAVHNIYANWCRTRSRKYKDTYLPTLEDGGAWESLIEDPHACRQETLTELSRAVDRISNKSGGGRREDIIRLLEGGHSLAEVVQELSLPKSILKSRDANP